MHMIVHVHAFEAIVRLYTLVYIIIITIVEI